MHRYLLSICNEQYIVRLNVAQLRYKQGRIEGRCGSSLSGGTVNGHSGREENSVVDRAFLSTR